MALENTPLFFSKGGNINANLLWYAGMYGRYISSTVYGNDSTNSYNYGLVISATGVNVEGAIGRQLGQSVRCLAE